MNAEYDQSAIKGLETPYGRRIKITIGIDLADKRHEVCILGAEAEILKRQMAQSLG